MNDINTNHVINQNGRLAYWYFGLLLFYIFILVNWQFPLIRFESPVVNYMTMLIGLSAPIIMVLIAVCFIKWPFKIVSAILPLPLILLSLILGIFTWSELGNIWNSGRDYSFERLDSINFAHSRVTVYRTNGGATTSYGLELRQEKTVFPGVMLVRRVRSFYPAYEAEVSAIGKNALKVTIVPYPYRANQAVEKDVTVALKSWLYM